LGLLLADVAIYLHKSSKCKVPTCCKDFVDTAITTSGAGAAAFMVFLVLVLFVLCLKGMMSLVEEYESLSFCMEEDKGDCLLLKQFSIFTVAALVVPPVAMTLTCVEGRDVMGALHFNGAFMIPFIHGSLPIILYRNMRQYHLQDLAISSISSLPQVCWVQENYVLSDKRLFKIHHGLQT
jgi:hypothetical protein